jgi:large subunit ribosomal protein L6
LDLKVHPKVMVAKTKNEIKISVKNPEEKRQAALWGLHRNLINNMVIGVTEGFSKQLEISGIGFKATLEGNDLVLNVGHSHPVKFKIPEGIEVKVEKNIITISGIDKQKVGQVAAEIRAIRKVEPYKGKGIKYVGEQVRRKAGKQAVKTE